MVKEVPPLLLLIMQGTEDASQLHIQLVAEADEFN
jgi:hypothetical protein